MQYSLPAIIASLATSLYNIVDSVFIGRGVGSMFTTDDSMIAIARRGFRIFFLFYPCVRAQIVIQNYFQSIGRPAWSIFLSLTRQLIFLIPLLAILPGRYGVDGVWMAMCSSDIIAFALALVTMLVINRRIGRELQQRARL